MPVHTSVPHVSILVYNIYRPALSIETLVLLLVLTNNALRGVVSISKKYVPLRSLRMKSNFSAEYVELLGLLSAG